MPLDRWTSSTTHLLALTVALIVAPAVAPRVALIRAMSPRALRLSDAISRWLDPGPRRGSSGGSGRGQRGVEVSREVG